MGVKLGRLFFGKNTLREFDYRVLRRIFGPTKEEVTGD
jgi:hypothetical protein